MSAGSAIQRRPCQLLNPIIVLKMSMPFSRSWRQSQLLFKAKQNLRMHNMSRELSCLNPRARSPHSTPEKLWSGHFIRYSDQPPAKSKSNANRDGIRAHVVKKRLADAQASIGTGKEEDSGRGDRDDWCQRSCRSGCSTPTSQPSVKKKEESSSERQLCGDRCLIGVRGQRSKCPACLDTIEG